MKAFVRYLAVNTPRPEAMADYYKKYFGLSEVVRSPEGDIALYQRHLPAVRACASEGDERAPDRA